MTTEQSCRDCGRTPQAFRGRGLCPRCYQRRWHLGTLPDAERSTYRRDELVSEAHHLMSAGEDIHRAAQRLGVTVWAIYKARARTQSTA